ncbi:hypothetical protein PYW07_011304 [Mythimna separata]|uniref:Uncharacterized protein n=1 Tax=Mythimna separata TaxID=271217 RepID=A0AAD7Y9T4_MYTSE|nr:hypothetical protein PYW07_011304 [Mythimna separata]
MYHWSYNRRERFVSIAGKNKQYVIYQIMYKTIVVRCWSGFVEDPVYKQYCDYSVIVMWRRLYCACNSWDMVVLEHTETTRHTRTTTKPTYRTFLLEHALQKTV